MDLCPAPAEVGRIGWQAYLTPLLLYTLVLAINRFGYYLRWRDTWAEYAVRRVLYMIPLWVPVFVFARYPSWHWHTEAVFIGVPTLVCSLVLNRVALRNLFNRDLIMLMGSPAMPYVIIETGATLVAVLGEEFFYRGYLVTTLASRLGWAAVPITAACFVVHHWVHPRAAAIYAVEDALVQGVMGVGLGWAFQSGESLLMPVLVHGIYNAIHLTGLYVRFALAKGDAA